VLAIMLNDRALTRVEQVAASAGLGVRSLQRLFAQYVGVGPKAVLTRYRLQDALAAVDAGEAEDLSELAARLGWFDQAHLTRDFGRSVGRTPSAYRREAAVSCPRR
jgi:transcriptional regulator GlxA family with amidase domain